MARSMGSATLRHTIGPLWIGICVTVVGSGLYFGKGKMIRRLPLLSDKEQSLIVAVAGLAFVVVGLVHLF